MKMTAKPSAGREGEDDGRSLRHDVALAADGAADERDGDDCEQHADVGDRARPLAVDESDAHRDHRAGDSRDRCHHGHRTTRQRAVEAQQRQRPAAPPNAPHSRSELGRHGVPITITAEIARTAAGELTDQRDVERRRAARRTPTAVVGHPVDECRCEGEQDRHVTVLAAPPVPPTTFDLVVESTVVLAADDDFARGAL